MKKSNVITSRPAEIGGGVVAAIIALLVAVFDLRPEVAAPLIVVLGAVPAAITWLVNLWRRRELERPVP